MPISTTSIQIQTPLSSLAESAEHVLPFAAVFPPEPIHVGGSPSERLKRPRHLLSPTRDELVKQRQKRCRWALTAVCLTWRICTVEMMCDGDCKVIR